MIKIVPNISLASITGNNYRNAFTNSVLEDNKNATVLFFFNNTKVLKQLHQKKKICQECFF